MRPTRAASACADQVAASSQPRRLSELSFRPGASLRPRQRCGQARPSPGTRNGRYTCLSPDTHPPQLPPSGAAGGARRPPPPAPGGMPDRPRSPLARHPSNAPRPPGPSSHCIFMTPGAGRGRKRKREPVSEEPGIKRPLLPGVAAALLPP